MKTSNFVYNYLHPQEIRHGLESSAFHFLLILTFSQVVALQAWQMLYTNYVVDALHLSGAQGGIIQSVREIPGLLAISVLIFLRFIKEESMASFSVMLLGVGVACTGLFPTYSGMLMTTFIMSVGFHYFETINQSITLQSFNGPTCPIVFARLRSIAAFGNICIALIILSIATYLSYKQMFLFAGIVATMGAIFAIRKKPDLSILTQQRKSIVFKKKYWLFYILTFLSGGRRQIFTIFSLFLLVEKFQFSVTMITSLFLINNVCNWLLNPLIGKLINRFGEQKLLIFQFLPAIGIFLGYAYVDVAAIVAIFYIFDQLTFNLNIAEKTFFQKIGEPQDIAPSMALSFTINHISAVIVPVIGATLWAIDFAYPFILGAVLAAVSLFFVCFINAEIAKNTPKA